jgi:pimeloyl-ACP methyl ester carboxylesterase/DNA-binding CsgD family transcriptional regulator
MSHPAEQIRFCASRDDTRIAYTTCGSGPPLVWAAHWVQHLKVDWDSPVWGPWLRLLTRRHALIRYSWRGCGLSDRDEVQFAHDRYVEDLEAVIDAAGAERFVLFGMSSGARISMTYAVRHPMRVSQLVLLGSSPCGRVARGQSKAMAEEEETRLKAVEIGWTNATPAYGQFFTALHIPDANAEQMCAYNELLRFTTSPANAVAIMRSLHRADVRDIVPKVNCPALVMHSRGDSIIPFDEGRRVAAQIPGARFVPLESRNHLIVDSEPAWQQVTHAMDEFLPASTNKPSTVTRLRVGELTVREHQVLELVAQGLDNEAIGTRLKISEKTVRNHVSVILAKLDVNSRVQAVVCAREAGFGHGSEFERPTLQ